MPVCLFSSSNTVSMSGVRHGENQRERSTYSMTACLSIVLARRMLAVFSMENFGTRCRMIAVSEIESRLKTCSARGNKTAAHYVNLLSYCHCDADKLAVIEDMKDDALRFHGFMIDFSKYLEI